MKKTWNYSLLLLLVVGILAWLAVLSKPGDGLRVVACDVGQGDAILITEGSTQVLIDGGPGNKVISCLSRYMAFWDRELEVVVSTHPDADHSSGLVEVFRSYKVDRFITTEVDRDTNVYTTLKELVEASGTDKIFTRKGDRFNIGKLHLEVLHPPHSMISSVAPEKSNNYSIVLKLSYGEFDALLTGDIEDAMSDLIAESFDLSGIEYLKVPHHGSKNGLSEKMLFEVKPQIAVISAGKNNRFGHPHEEVLEMLNRQAVNILRTDEVGDMVIETNGQVWW